MTVLGESLLLGLPLQGLRVDVSTLSRWLRVTHLLLVVVGSTVPKTRGSHFFQAKSSVVVVGSTVPKIRGSHFFHLRAPLVKRSGAPRRYAAQKRYSLYVATSYVKRLSLSDDFFHKLTSVLSIFFEQSTSISGTDKDEELTNNG